MLDPNSFPSVSVSSVFSVVKTTASRGQADSPFRATTGT